MTNSEGIPQLVQRGVRSPRSAALAGILYSLLIVTSMILLRTGAIVKPAEIGRDWLEVRSAEASVVLVLIPFAGIAFLWFTGVIRDLLGDSEDKFFATVFLGSGLIQVVMMFVWAAAYGAMFATYQAVAGALTDFDVFIYATAFTNEIFGNYFLRMSAVYMLSIGSLWTRTKVVPRWLSIVPFIVALAFALIVMFDASTVRRAADTQARLLNEMVDELFKEHRFSEKKLAELLGHTRFEVFMGMVIGVLVGIVAVSVSTRLAAVPS